MRPEDFPLLKARPRTYSERVIFFSRASARIRRASSIVTLNVNVVMVLPYYQCPSDQVEPFLKKPRFPEAVIATSQRVGTAPPNYNMSQQRDIHSGCCFLELPCELDICRAWGRIP